MPVLVCFCTSCAQIFANNPEVKACLQKKNLTQAYEKALEVMCREGSDFRRALDALPQSRINDSVKGLYQTGGRTSFDALRDTLHRSQTDSVREALALGGFKHRSKFVYPAFCLFVCFSSFLFLVRFSLFSHAGLLLLLPLLLFPLLLL